jgi:hypothetical protein
MALEEKENNAAPAQRGIQCRQLSSAERAELFPFPSDCKDDGTEVNEPLIKLLAAGAYMNAA